MKRLIMVMTCVSLFGGAAAAQDADPAPLKKKEVKLESSDPKSAAQGVSVTHKGRGRLTVKDPTWDFGYVAQGARVTHEYLLENSGDDTLFIEQVKPTCGCTSAPLSKDKLAPGERVPVEVTFSTGKFSGPVRKHVTVLSSDAQQPNTSLEFSAVVGSVPPTLGLSPETGVALDRFPLTESREGQVALTNYSPTAVAIAIVGPPPGYLDARLTRERLEPRQEAQLIVKTRAGEPPLGKFSGAVTIEVQGEQPARLTIPVTGVSLMK